MNCHASAGIDPDIKGTAWAILREGQLIAAGRFRAKCKLGAAWEIGEALPRELKKWEVSAVAIEGQDLSYTGKTNRARPQDLADLSFVAGAATCAAMRQCSQIFNPLPSEWKGSVPKGIHHARVFTALGVPFTSAPDGKYCWPSALPFGLNRGDWVDVSDAVGLALWASKQKLLLLSVGTEQ